MTETQPEIAGRVEIEWPNAERCAFGPLQSWRTLVRDVDTGETLGGVLAVAVTATTGNGPIVADITSRDGEGWWDPADGPLKVVRYEVMRMIEGPGLDTLTEVWPYRAPTPADFALPAHLTARGAARP